MFYPIIQIPGFEGWTQLVNFPPNNWENKDQSGKLIYVCWADGQHWHTRFLQHLPYGTSCRITTADLGKEIMQNGIAFLYPSAVELLPILDELPSAKTWVTHTPAWRSTIGISYGDTQVSYQGEIEPFPDKASLLTFHPFIQFATGFSNYLVVFNLQKQPLLTATELEIFRSSDYRFIASREMKKNSLTLIPLDEFGFGPHDLPVFVNRQISGIPFGFGVTADKTLLSLEHTHPPASLVLHGNRMAAQSGIKSSWFKKLVKI